MVPEVLEAFEVYSGRNRPSVPDGCYTLSSPKGERAEGFQVKQFVLHRGKIVGDSTFSERNPVIYCTAYLIASTRGQHYGNGL